MSPRDLLVLLAWVRHSEERAVGVQGASLV